MKTVLTYSGGLDSTVLLYYLIARGDEVYALSVYYGQRHARELQAAREICSHDNLTNGRPGHLAEFHLAELNTLTKLLQGSSQTSLEIPVPEGHYTHESMKATVVPNRNMILLSLATAWAVSLKGDGIAYAAHAGDHAIYPDCRPEFAQCMAVAISLADDLLLNLERPFISKTKADLVTLGSTLGVPFALTWSCYKGGTVHCGKCGTCVERREAFQVAQVPDPTEYQS